MTELSVRRMDEASEPAAETPGMGLRRLCAGNAGIRLSDARFVLQRHPLFSQVSENSEQLSALQWVLRAPFDIAREPRQPIKTRKMRVKSASI